MTVIRISKGCLMERFKDGIRYLQRAVFAQTRRQGCEFGTIQREDGVSLINTRWAATEVFVSVLAKLPRCNVEKSKGFGLGGPDSVFQDVDQQLAICCPFFYAL